MYGWLKLAGAVLAATVAPLAGQAGAREGCPAAADSGAHQHAGRAPGCAMGCACVGRGEGTASGGQGMDHAMMMRMDSLDARLDSLATMIRTGRGERRLGAMADILQILVGHQREMRRSMHERMMGRGGADGMQHQMAGDSARTQCPMMGADSAKAGGGGHNH